MHDGNVLQFRRRNHDHKSIAFIDGIRDAAKVTKLLVLLNISAIEFFGLQMILFSEASNRSVEAAFSIFEIWTVTKTGREPSI